ncbi:MAG: hypothetical protein IJ024_00230 [Lachnospiraceae bacterium]|nr:hypothetical protein [Lachnospiraceae bacterium]
MFRNIILAFAGIVIVLILIIVLLRQEDAGVSKDIENTENMIDVSENNDSQEVQETSKVDIDERKETSINLGNGMRITEVGKYTGVYMEDGSDEIVSGVMMIVVQNEGENTIQYAEITMPVGEEEAFFTMSTLTPGSTMILLEQNRMAYIDAEYTTAVAENVAIFSEPLSLCEDKLKLQILDGAINVSNISGEDINGDIMIYYKNSSVDAFYGGITYRVRIEGGLKKDEIKQIMASHFSESGSTIMFVTIGEN